MSVKYNWSDYELNFIRENFHKMTNQQLADALGLKLTHMRTQCYAMGLKRMEMEYWTEAQKQFLIDFYTIIGDVEMAELFNEMWPKNKEWTNKHIEKKRRYLKLKRTRKQIAEIIERNRVNGRNLKGVLKMWKTRGSAPEGDIRYWMTGGRLTPFVKVNGRFNHWARHTWETTYGPVPKGMNVAFKNDDRSILQLSNLELITDGELSKRNSIRSSKGLSDNYVAGMLSHNDPELRKLLLSRPDLIELKRQQLKLNRIINESTEAS